MKLCAGIDSAPAPPTARRLMRRPPLAAWALATVLGATGTLAGCNTTQGVGEDLSSAGDALATSAEDNRSY